MVLKIEQFNLENIIGSKNSIAILRLVVLKPYLSFGLTELSNKLRISKSNILRILSILKKHNIILELFSKRKKRYKTNSQLKLCEHLFNVFMLEKQNNLKPEIKNAIDLMYSRIKDKVRLFILFGSTAKGLETKKSDVDILVVGEKGIEGIKTDIYPFRFEVHNYKINDLENLKDFIVIDSLLNGIVYKGDIFPILSKVESIPKDYVLYRLKKSEEFLNKLKSLKGEAKRYYQNLIKITIGEIESLLKDKITLSKKEIKAEISEKKIKELERLISIEGNKIWII